MITRRNVLSVFFAALAFALVGIDSDTAMAQGGNRIRLVANMASGATKARLRYDEINANRRKLNFELEKGTAGQMLTVKANGAIVGTATVNSLGIAKFELDTRKGQQVPVLTAGASVEVLAGNTVIMSGTLR